MNINAEFIPSTINICALIVRKLIKIKLLVYDFVWTVLNKKSYGQLEIEIER